MKTLQITATEARGASVEADRRIERLSVASLNRIIEPDESVSGSIGAGQVLPDELLSIAGLDLDLDDEQRRVLSREEVASIADAGIRFEAVLTAGFAMDIVRRRDLTDPRVTYILHELGEETRHSRLFVRMLSQLQPKARNPVDNRFFRLAESVVLPRLISMPTLFCVLVITGEEIPDLIQKLASEHPATDPFIREVNRYHRQEEARHLSFARIVLTERWHRAGKIDRFLVKRFAPFIVGGMFEMLVHPGVYEVVGLPRFRTWRAVNRTPQRLALKHRASRSLLRALIDAEALTPGRIPRSWRRVCGVDRQGRPVDDLAVGRGIDAAA